MHNIIIAVERGYGQSLNYDKSNIISRLDIKYFGHRRNLQSLTFKLQYNQFIKEEYQLVCRKAITVNHVI